jgi:hypothetical protein
MALFRLFIAMMAGGFVGVHFLKVGQPEKLSAQVAGLTFVFVFLLLTL